MTKEKKKPVLKKVDPLVLPDFFIILGAASGMLSLAVNLSKIMSVLQNKDRSSDARKWRNKAEEVKEHHENYKRLAKEILLLLGELETGFGEKEIQAGNLLMLTDRNKFYRLLSLKNDLIKLSGQFIETLDELNKFVIENNFPEFKLEKEDELLSKFDKVMSLWGKGTFNDAAIELKGLNRLIEKRLGYEGHNQGER
jgi:hypothetical protein